MNLCKGIKSSMAIREAQEEVDLYISQFKEGYFPHLLNLARMTEEVGEVARVVSHLNGKKPKVGEEIGDLGEELADLLFVIICMANRDRIDLGEKLSSVIDKYNSRDASRWTKK